MQKFDLLNTPLEGSNLIEASAGTGKTYAIAGIYLRLILEKRLPVERILVVTYTEAATSELKERIRGRLLESRQAFQAGASPDGFLNGLVHRHMDTDDALDLINDAIRCFDQSSIFTIHGFCMRTLYENAFESGSLFDTELIESLEELEMETVDDFWRKRFHKASGLYMNYLIQKKICPETLLASISAFRNHPELTIIPASDSVDAGIQELRYRDIVKAASNEWQVSKEEIERILMTDEGLNRNRYRPTTIRRLMDRMDGLMSSAQKGPPLFDGFEKFTQQSINRSTRRDFQPPKHRFFSQCEQLQKDAEALTRVYDDMLVRLKMDLIGFIKDEMTRRKRTENVRSFNDLLTDVYRSVCGGKGKLLSDAIRRAYGAALIDEFQDTDPIQYGIFQEVFGKKHSTLFLIGDPKQAIYGFRGADIFTYMKAAKKVKHVYTLGENYRSEPSFIRAVNTIFQNASAPFVFEDVRFEPAGSPGESANLEPFSLKDEKGKPFIIWHVTREENTGARRPKTTNQVIADAVAGEISRLLSRADKGWATVGTRPFTSGDVAVLVRTNAEADVVKSALNRLNIPGVVYGSGNVLDSPEAKALERVLSGIIRPERDRVLKAALSTPLFKLCGDDFCREGDANDVVETHREVLMTCQDLWRIQGFMKMFRTLLRRGRLMMNLISLPDGERRITNILHLGDILQRKSMEAKYDPEDLLKWFQRQLNPEQIRLREEQLRLESDENAVKIITIHKSKGLEFPVVFCPFLQGRSALGKKDPVLFHDTQNHMKLTLDFGSEHLNDNRGRAEKELLAENLRLVYVALTRAKSRCYMVWGKFDNAETSAPAYLFHQPERMEGDTIEATRTRYRSLDDHAVLEALSGIETRSRGSIEVTPIPDIAGKPFQPDHVHAGRLVSPSFDGRIKRSWRISSFSSIVHRRYGDDAADHDGIFGAREAGGVIDLNASDDADNDSIFHFPKGAKAGTCLHEIFEHIEFTEPDSSHTAGVVEQKLAEYGFRADWKETVCRMVKNVLTTPLAGDRNALTLSRIRRGDRISELGFYYPIHNTSPKRLKKIFSDHGLKKDFSQQFLQQLDRLDAQAVSGFMKGFIDLIVQYRNRFYIVDWKSNFLGRHCDNYHLAALSAEMDLRLYILQYHIYTVALHKYLALRMPGYSYETHFGGVYYIFLRGVDGRTHGGGGVYYDRPGETLMNALCREFEGATHD